jgi:peptide/nickel transport system ATP-binding protein
VSMASVLTVDALVTEFRLRSGAVTAVDGVSFEIEPGECVGLVGESGCGKSTTGLSIMRLLPPNGSVTGGTISLEGKDLARLSEPEMQKVRGNEIALIPQDPLTSLNPTMRIGRQIAEGMRIHTNASREEAEARALEVLRLVEMPRPEERLNQYPHELSGGLRQRVMIAMALVCEPKLLIADEPTTALDVTIQAQILDLLDSLRDKLNMSVLLITHDMGVIAGRTDRVVVMYAGKVAEEAPTERLFGSTRHPYAAALLASVPTIEERGNLRLVSIPGLPPDLSREIVGCRFAPRCQFASGTCRTREPHLESIDEGTHRFACFHPVDGVAAVAQLAQADAVDRAGVTTEANETLVKVDNLVKEFPVYSGGVFRRKTGSVKAVSDVSFEIKEGETFGLVGESGCGKTTVSKLLTVLEAADSGTIAFDGTDVLSLGGKELRRRRRDLQLMFQDPYASLDPRMRVGAIIQEPLKVQGIGSDAEQKARVHDLLGEVGLASGAATRFPHEFSGGQRQRIGFARALALEPRLIVADEPVSALDVSIQAQLLNLMKDLQTKRGLTLLLVSHDLAVMRYMADSIGVMYLGKLVEIGPAATILSTPAHPYSQGLLDAVPVPDVAEARSRRGLQIRGELPSPVDPPSGCRFRTRCPRAQDLCADEEPAFQEFAGGNRAACHFPLTTPVALARAGNALA